MELKQLLNKLLVPHLYLVGGAVRDLLLNGDLSSIKDFDFVSEEDPAALVENLVKEYNAELKTFSDFLTYKLIFSDGFEVDIARARSEVYQKAGALPTVSAADKIEDDLYRRDFTINAMALKVSDLYAYVSGDKKELQVLDLFDGRGDLRRKQIKILHEKSFIDDPTRIFRGFRYAVRLGYEFEATTMELIKEALRGGALKTISKRRILNELKKISVEDKAYDTTFALLENGVLRESGLYSDEEKVLAALADKDAFLVKERDDRLKYFLSLCYKAASEEEKAGYIKDFQLGKSFVREFAE